MKEKELNKVTPDATPDVKAGATPDVKTEYKSLADAEVAAMLLKFIENPLVRIAVTDTRMCRLVADLLDGMTVDEAVAKNFPHDDTPAYNRGVIDGRNAAIRERQSRRNVPPRDVEK